MAFFEVTSGDDDHDEVRKYEMGRYKSSNEAVCRILNFPIHERHPTVVHRDLHLENGQRVYFTSENAAQRAVAPQDTTLIVFFKLCTQNEFARTLLYNRVSKYYTWNSRNRTWNKRKQGQLVPEQPGIRSSDALGRIYTIHPSNSECFHLRLLLHEVQGPMSFTDLRTINRQVCETFK